MKKTVFALITCIAWCTLRAMENKKDFLHNSTDQAMAIGIIVSDQQQRPKTPTIVSAPPVVEVGIKRSPSSTSMFFDSPCGSGSSSYSPYPYSYGSNSRKPVTNDETGRVSFFGFP